MRLARLTPRPEIPQRADFKKTFLYDRAMKAYEKQLEQFNLEVQVGTWLCAYFYRVWAYTDARTVTLNKTRLNELAMNPPGSSVKCVRGKDLVNMYAGAFFYRVGRGSYAARKASTWEKRDEPRLSVALFKLLRDLEAHAETQIKDIEHKMSLNMKDFASVNVAQSSTFTLTFKSAHEADLFHQLSQFEVDEDIAPRMIKETPVVAAFKAQAALRRTQRFHNQRSVS